MDYNLRRTTFLNMNEELKNDTGNYVGSDVGPAQRGSFVENKKEDPSKYQVTSAGPARRTFSIQDLFKNVSFCKDEQDIQNQLQHIKEILNSIQYRFTKAAILEILDEKSYAPIHYTVLGNNRLVLAELINVYKCDVNLLGYGGQTPLHLAARSPDIEKELAKNNKNVETDSIINTLLNNHADVNMKDDKNRTPLHIALKNKSINIISRLMRCQLNWHIPDIQKESPVTYLFRYGDVSTVQTVLSDRETANKIFSDENAFQIALAYNYRDFAVKYSNKPLTQLSADNNCPQLILAAINGSGINGLNSVEHMVRNTKSILYWLCREPNGDELIAKIDCPEVLITEETMSYQCLDDDNYTPLMIAVKYRRIAWIKTLVQSKHYTSAVMKQHSKVLRRNVFHLCAELNEQKITETLIPETNPSFNPIDVMAADVKGNTPLHICCQRNNSLLIDKIMKLLNTRKSEVLEEITKKNHDGFSAFHEAVRCGNYNAVKQMMTCMGQSKVKLIADVDRYLQTVLHMAAFKGHIRVLELILDNPNVKVNICDTNDCTPLHEVARGIDSNEKEEKSRRKCIKNLVMRGADVNAINSEGETPLMIACQYSKKSVVEHFLQFCPDVELVNFRQYNCFELAIRKKNTEVVDYFIGSEHLFPLMRNAQLINNYRDRKLRHDLKEDRNKGFSCFVENFRHLIDCKWPCVDRCNKSRIIDTPMRKLIISMPDMASKVFDRCLMTLGADGVVLHTMNYHYEFLDDNFIAHTWVKNPWAVKGKVEGTHRCHLDDIGENQPYTRELTTLVRNHPLFLIAEKNQYSLMFHTLPRSLFAKRITSGWKWFFFCTALFYLAYIICFTVAISRTTHPQVYYQSVNIKFSPDPGACKEVIQALNGTVVRDSAEESLHKVLLIFWIILVIKDIFVYFTFCVMDVNKSFKVLPEIVGLAFQYYFIYDYDFQESVTMRCPIQWYISACGIFIGYLALLYYVQFVPVIGVYIVMLRVLLMRFVLFIPVMLALVAAFASTFFMLFQNFDAFSSLPLALIKIVIMSTGEINYDDLMYNDKTEAYYKGMSYLMICILVIILTILITNMLIGLAAGDIGELLENAKKYQMDKSYELGAFFEMLRYQTRWVARWRGKIWYTYPFVGKRRDLTKPPGCWKMTKRMLSHCCTREVEADQDD